MTISVYRIGGYIGLICLRSTRTTRRESTTGVSGSCTTAVPAKTTHRLSVLCGMVFHNEGHFGDEDTHTMLTQSTVVGG